MLSKGKVVEVADSSPRIAVMLDMMRSVYQKVSGHMSWLHLQTLAYQAVSLGQHWSSYSQGESHCSQIHVS